MDPFTIAMIIGLAISVGGSIAADLGTAGERAEAARLMQQATDATGKINLPTLNNMVAQQLGVTNLSKIVTNPQLAMAQYNALGKLKDISDSGGLTLEDRAALKKQMGEVSQHEQAGRNAVANQMNARGMGGSGAELAMLMGNQQAAANRGADIGLNTAAMAQKRAFDAILARGDMASKIRGQEYGEKANAAHAQDLIDRYNADARTRAQYENNFMIPQQQFQNQMGLTNLQNGARQHQAAYDTADADRQRRMWANMAGSAGQTVMGYGAQRYGTTPGVGGGGQYDAGNPGYRDDWNWEEYPDDI